MKTCPECGTPASDEAVYCVNGHKFEDIPDILKEMMGDKK